MWRRKLQEQGKASLAISLPKEWTIDFNLKKGDELVLNKDTHGNLIINSSKDAKETHRTIQIPQNLENLRREILSFYLHGVKEILITSKDKLDTELRIKIKEMISSLIGFEMMDDSSNQILVKDMLNYSQISIEDLLRRIVKIVVSMYEDIYESIEKKDTELAHGIIERDYEVNNLYLLTIKCIRSALAFRTFEDISMDYIEYLDHLIVARDLERVGDCIKDIGTFIANNKLLLSESNITKLKSILTEIKKIFESSFEIFFKKDIERATTLVKSNKKTEKSLRELSQNIFRDEKNPEVIDIVNNLSKILEYAIDITEMVRKE